MAPDAGMPRGGGGPIPHSFCATDTNVEHKARKGRPGGHAGCAGVVLSLRGVRGVMVVVGGW